MSTHVISYKGFGIPTFHSQERFYLTIISHTQSKKLKILGCPNREGFHIIKIRHTS